MVKRHVTKLGEIEDPNARDHISIRCIPFILSGSPNEAGYIHVRACVIAIWRLGLGAPLVTGNNYYCLENSKGDKEVVVYPKKRFYLQYFQMLVAFINLLLS